MSPHLLEIGSQWYQSWNTEVRLLGQWKQIELEQIGDVWAHFYAAFSDRGCRYTGWYAVCHGFFSFFLCSTDIFMCNEGNGSSQQVMAMLGSTWSTHNMSTISVKPSTWLSSVFQEVTLKEKQRTQPLPRSFCLTSNCLLTHLHSPNGSAREVLLSNPMLKRSHRICKGSHHQSRFWS